MAISRRTCLLLALVFVSVFAGWHFIDLYPGIYKGEDMSQVNNFRIP